MIEDICAEPEVCCESIIKMQEDFRNCPNDDCDIWSHKLCQEHIGFVAYIIHKHIHPCD